MTTLEARMGGIESKLETLNNSVLILQGNVMPRAEVYAETAKRVSVERFDGETAALRASITRLENGPQKLLGWLALSVSAGIGCLSLLLVFAGLLATILIAIFTHS